jgi:hypothetical protein
MDYTCRTPVCKQQSLTEQWLDMDPYIQANMILIDDLFGYLTSLFWVLLCRIELDGGLWRKKISE